MPGLEILADHCVYEPTVAFLRSSGYTVRRLVDVGGHAMTDVQVADLAARHGWLLLTQDRAFKGRVTYRRRAHPGVVLLKDVQSHPDAVHKRLLRLLASPPRRLAAAMAVIDRRSCRIVPVR
jgi:predicted nuclease of predicted toxin-antitoxin system